MAGQRAARLARLLGQQLKAFQQNEARSISSAANGAAGRGSRSGPAASPAEGQHRGVAQVAVQQAVQQQQLLKVVVPDIKVDLVGAVSMVAEGEKVEPGVFKNMDGHRFEDGRYAAFIEEITKFLPKERQYSDPVRTFAYGTDASFYRLNPKLVVKVHNEEEVKRIMPIAERLGVPITFRAAGTSLSGQAITDSVLLKLSHTGKNFRNYTVHVSCPGHSPRTAS
jgi:D-lactate dehydrogenase